MCLDAVLARQRFRDRLRRSDYPEVPLDGVQSPGVPCEQALQEVEAFDELLKKFSRVGVFGHVLSRGSSETCPRCSRPGDASHDRVGAKKAEERGTTGIVLSAELPHNTQKQTDRGQLTTDRFA